MNHPIQVNTPYSMLLKNLDFILEREINPEIYFDGEAIDTFNENDAHCILRALASKGTEHHNPCSLYGSQSRRGRYKNTESYKG